ncbi:pyridoxal phosphate-dependent decarboxylase family protein [Novosphingobium pentaromativorans]|nr:pyridoxal-dependent decarboxylase [Novosphingobium pentaromativorans]
MNAPVQPTSLQDVLSFAAHHATISRSEGAEMHAAAGVKQLRTLFDIPLDTTPRDAVAVLAELVEAAKPGLSATTSPGFLSWVIGGSHPAGVAADWLTSAWGQNAAIYQCAPSAAVAEEVASKWLLELLSLPPECSVGFTTGATMATFTCLSTARLALLDRLGVRIEECGLAGAPPLEVFIGDDAHVTNFAALRYLGFGSDQIRRVACNDGGTFELQALAKAMEDSAAAAKIVIGQAGQMISGAFDDFAALAQLCSEHQAWLHVDGAFGMWVRASERRRFLAKGAELADSWSVDGHKWLQLPYDCGFAITRHAQYHRRAMTMDASYLTRDECDGRHPSDYVPELSRRARGFPAWVMMQVLGRDGIGQMVERHCAAASELAARIDGIEGVELCHAPTINQLALRLTGIDDAQGDALTHAMTERLNATGRHFLKTAQWRDHTIMRVSIMGHETDAQTVAGLARDIEVLCREHTADANAAFACNN